MIRFFLVPFAILAIYLLPLQTVSPAIAGPTPQERLADPMLESRAQHIFTQLRCLVCQNQTIIDSDARIAADLRLLVRTRLQEGESDRAIMDYIHSRYGDFVLMRPPITPSTWGLWLAPALILILGGVVAVFVIRKGKEDAE